MQFSTKNQPTKRKAPWNKGKKGVQIVSKETRALLSIARKGNKNALGTKHTDEFKQAKSRDFKKKWKDGTFKVLRGEDAQNWQGGKTPENRRVRATLEYKYWRNDVFERDDYTCQGCGDRGCYLEAHHILSFAQFPQKRFDIKNGLTLCLPCHKKTDNYKGNGNKK